MTYVDDKIHEVERRVLKLHDKANSLLAENITTIDAETVLIMTRYIHVDVMDLITILAEKPQP